FHHMMLRKLGLVGRRELAAADDELLAGLGPVLSEVETDMTLFCRRLAQLPVDRMRFDGLRDAYYGEPDSAYQLIANDWLALYAARIRAERLDDGERRARMDAVNPLYVPRNYLLQEVIDATERGDRAALPEILD